MVSNKELLVGYRHNGGEHWSGSRGSFGLGQAGSHPGLGLQELWKDSAYSNADQVGGSRKAEAWFVNNSCQLFLKPI